MTAPDKASLLARLAQAIAATNGEPVESRLCKMYLQVVGGDGASLSLSTTRPERMLLCSTDEAATRLEELQEVLGEGPSLQAYRSGHIVSVDLRSPTGDWSSFASAALEAVGGLSIDAIPIRPGGEVVGVLTAHRAGSDGPDPATAQLLADAIGTTLLRVPAGYFDDTGSADWTERAVVHQATGMVVVQLRISPEDAVALLRAHAFAQNSSLSEVAQRIVQRELRFADPDNSIRTAATDPPSGPPSGHPDGTSDTGTDTDGGSHTS